MGVTAEWMSRARGTVAPGARLFKSSAVLLKKLKRHADLQPANAIANCTRPIRTAAAGVVFMQTITVSKPARQAP
jgi:hypothetical protein